MITTSNRINNLVGTSTGGSGYLMETGTSGFQTNNDWSTLAKGDPNEAIYITRLVKLATKATALTVSFAASRHPDTTIGIYYKVNPVGSTGNLDEQQWVNMGSVSYTHLRAHET